MDDEFFGVVKNENWPGPYKEGHALSKIQCPFFSKSAYTFHGAEVISLNLMEECIKLHILIHLLYRNDENTLVQILMSWKGGPARLTC